MGHCLGHLCVIMHPCAVQLFDPGNIQFPVGNTRGDKERAGEYAAIVNSAVETPRDPYLQTTKPSTYIKLRMSRCMDDPDGYFATWRKADVAPLSSLWVELQRGGERASGGVRRDWAWTRPERAELGSDYRQLPERYLPALTGWQTPAAAGS